MRRRVVVAAALALAIPLAARPATDPGKKLEELQRAIDERRQRVEAFERREQGLLETLESIDHAQEALEEAVRRADARTREARAELARLEAREGEIAQRRARTQRAMAARAVALYKMGDVGPARVVFTAGDLRDLLSRMRTLRFLLDHDARLLQRFREETAALAEARAASTAAVAERDRAVSERDGRARELERERETKGRVLASVRGDRTREEAALQELESAAHELEETLTRLGRTPPARGPAPAPGSLFASLRGRLEPPVDARVIRGFGRVVDPDFGTETFRKGVDFGAPLGTPVRAVADGEVRYAGWFRGYGKLVIVDHGEQWFTVSGHLADVRVSVGEPVREGDVIGSVGDTGSLVGPLLYFEIRKGSEPLDPRPWLRGGRGLD